MNPKKWDKKFQMLSRFGCSEEDGKLEEVIRSLPVWGTSGWWELKAKYVNHWCQDSVHECLQLKTHLKRVNQKDNERANFRIFLKLMCQQSYTE